MKKIRGSIEGTINLGNYENIKPSIQFEVDDSGDGYNEALTAFANFCDYIMKRWQSEHPASMIHFVNRVSVPPKGINFEPNKVSPPFKPSNR